VGGEFTRKRDRLSYEERGWHPPLYRCDRLHWGHSDVAIARQEEPHPIPSPCQGEGTVRKANHHKRKKPTLVRDQKPGFYAESEARNLVSHRDGTGVCREGFRSDSRSVRGYLGDSQLLFGDSDRGKFGRRYLRGRYSDSVQIELVLP